MRYLTVICVALVAVSWNVVSASQRRTTGPATFAVFVADATGKGITGVKVSLDGPAQRTATTEAGRIAFENLPAGTYHITFERDGFEPLAQDVVARGTRPIDVKVTLMAAAVKPVAPPAAAPAPAAPAAASDAKPVALDMPALIEKIYVGKASGKVSPLACAAGGDATLIQLNDPLADQRHADADEFLYVIAGQGNASLAGREEPLNPGVFLMIPRGVPHTLARSGRNPLVVLAVRAGDRCSQ